MEKEIIEEVKPNFFIAGREGRWRRVYPPKKDISKPFTWNNIHWFRFLIGSWGRFLTVSFIIVMILMLSWSYAKDTKQCRDMMEDSCFIKCVSEKKFISDMNRQMGALGFGWDENIEIDPSIINRGD